MQFHNLRRNTKQKTARRIGRGGKRGRYSGRGIKGLGARAGGKYRPPERELLKKIPKLRGYKFTSFQSRPAVVNLGDIDAKFAIGDTVSPATLRAKGLIRMMKGRLPKVKVLGRGELKKKLVFKDVMFSESAAQKLKSKE